MPTQRFICLIPHAGDGFVVEVRPFGADHNLLPGGYVTLAHWREADPHRQSLSWRWTPPPEARTAKVCMRMLGSRGEVDVASLAVSGV